jgi:hypothetical protein
MGIGMRIIERSLLTGLGIAVLAAAKPTTAAPLQPTGPWVVDYSNDQCLLDRNYGTDAKPLILVIRRVPMDSDVYVGVYSRDGRPNATTGNAKVAFGDAAPVPAAFRAYFVPAKSVRSFTSYVPGGAALIDQAAQSGSISVRAPGEVQDTFLVPALADGLRALDACVLDLGKSWGMPIDQQKRVKVLARPLRQYLQPEDYGGQLNRNANLRPQVRLWVDENGKPLNCVPLQSTASEEFASTTCRLLLQRASFSPARDADGKPVKSIFVYTVDWFVG